MTMVTREQVEAALDGIVDPCSVSVGVPLSIREMGLIDDVVLAEGGQVRIELRLTSPGCLIGVLNFEPEIESVVGAVEGVTGVAVHFNDPLTWTEDRISADGRRRLQEMRAAAAARRRLPVRPVDSRRDQDTVS